jgi:uncharacterized protein (TIGR03437 family)
MRRSVLCAVLAALGCASAWSQPVLRSTNPVVNSASYSSSIAQGSIFVVFGTNLAGDAVIVRSTLPATTTMGNCSIKFTPASGGTGIDAFMLYTTKNQIAGVVPSTVAPGTYNVTVTYNGQTSAPGKATVVAANPGIYTADASGAGMIQGQIIRSATEWDLTRFVKGSIAGTSITTSPAYPGSTLAIWGTGLGADAGSDSEGNANKPAVSFISSTQVTVGTKSAAVLYAGRGATLPGEDVVYITVPNDAEKGCNVPVSIKVGSAISNAVTVAIADTGASACTDPLLTTDTLTKLSQGGTVVGASFTLTKQVTSLTVPILGSLDINSEAVSGAIAKVTFSSLLQTYTGATTQGACTVYRMVGTQNDLLSSVPTATLLDAGAQLTLNGPNASNVAVPRGTDNAYSKTLTSGGLPGSPSSGAPVIAPGTYTLTAPGGADVSGFTASTTVPALLTWTNQAATTTVTRANGVTVNWSGGGGGNNIVLIVGMSGTQTSTAGVYDAAIFTCRAAASAGTFTVPSSVLTQLPATNGDLLSGNLGLLGLETVGDANAAKFTLPLKAGGNADYATFNYNIGVSKGVAYQ